MRDGSHLLLSHESCSLAGSSVLDARSMSLVVPRRQRLPGDSAPFPGAHATALSHFDSPSKSYAVILNISKGLRCNGQRLLLLSQHALEVATTPADSLHGFGLRQRSSFEDVR